MCLISTFPSSCSLPTSKYSLNHGLCNAFEQDAPFNKTASEAQSTWLNIFVPPIAARLNENLVGANLSNIDTISLMDLCAFDTVAAIAGKVSPFCNMFTVREWQEYGYYETLGKFYGYDTIELRTGMAKAYLLQLFVRQCFRAYTGRCKFS